MCTYYENTHKSDFPAFTANIDQDEKFDFSNVVELDLTATFDQIIFTIAPNPVRNTFNVTYKAVETEEMKLEVINAVGQQMYIQQLANIPGKVKVDVQQWAEGFYYVRLSGENSQKVFKIQVLR